MALDKEIAQDLIDDFVLSNDVELNTISTQNPVLFDATLNALNFLSARFGTGQKMQIVEKPKVVQEVVQGGLPFKNGDKFKVPEEKNEQTYTLKDIRLEDDQVMVSWYSLTDKIDKSYLDSIKDVTKRLNDGNWVLVGVFPYKVGDIFSFTIAGNKETAEIKSIDGDIVTFLYPTINNNLGVMPKSELLNQISKGNWVLINTSQFELGQILYDENEEELFQIREITSNGISLISAKGHVQFKDTGVLEKGIGGRGYILAIFKIGDVFTNNNSDIITINDLSTTNQNDIVLKVIRNGIQNSETRFWDDIETNISDGVLIPLIQSTPKITNNPNDIKIGDLIYSKIIDKVYEILDVNQNDVKLMTSKNQKDTGSLGVLNARIKDGDNIKLSFSIGDTFINPDGDFYKIMELYPNNEKSLYVKVNERANLDIFQWDILEDFVDDGYWMRGTKADADEIKANLSQAKPNATQAKMAQVTATPTKTPKKRLTKLEKEIKDLQEEIDGLLFLADEDDEAKAELQKKLIQIEALKTKKP
jgi:hypothetical protein